MYIVIFSTELFKLLGLFILFYTCADRADDAERKLAEAENGKTKLESELVEVTELLAKAEHSRTKLKNDLANTTKQLLSTANQVVEIESKLEMAERKATRAEQKLVAFDVGIDENPSVNGCVVDEENASIREQISDGEIVADYESDKDNNKIEPNPCCVQAVKYVLFWLGSYI